MARQDFIDAKQVLDDLEKSFRDVESSIKSNADTLKKLQTEYNKLPSGFINAQKQLLDITIKQSRAEKSLIDTKTASERLKQQELNTVIKSNQQKKTEIDLIAKQARETDRLNKIEQKAANDLARMSNAYQRIQKDVRELTQVYNDLAIRRQLGEQLSESEEAQLMSLENRLIKYRGALSAVDQKLGNYTRNVGNYASGWNGLSNSINQLTREAPAFAVSLNTGFLALSNNIPILADEIKNLIDVNKELVSQGKPTQSIFKTIASSVFSFQTALSVGVTLLTLYGGKLADWALSANKATVQVDLLREATERYNDTIVEVTTNSEKEMTAMRRKISVAQDVLKTDEERAFQAQTLIDQYPGYFKGLTKEQVMLGSLTKTNEIYNKAIRTLTGDIQKRIDAEAKQSAARETLKIVGELEQEVAVRQRANKEAYDAITAYGLESGAAKSVLKSIRERIKARKELTDEDQNYISKFGQIGIAESGAVSGIGLYTESQITELQQRSQALQAEIFKQSNEINKAFQETSLLDFKPDENTKKLQTEALKDIEASAFALNEARLENEADFNKKIFEEQSNAYADREYSAKRYGEIILELAQLRREEELRLLEKGTRDEIKELKKRAAEGEITLANANSVIKSLEQQSAYDRELIYENYSKAVIDANVEITESLKGVWEELEEGERALKQIEMLNNNLRQKGLILDNVDGNTTLKQFAEIENKLRDIQTLDENARIDEFRAQRIAIDNEIEKINQQEKNIENNQKINELLLEQRKIDSSILDIEIKRKEAVADIQKSMKQATSDYLQSIQSETLSGFGFSSLTSLFEQTTYTIINDLGEIETKSGSVFQKMFDQASTFQEKFAVAFNAITEIAQQAYSFINQASQQSFQLEYENIENRKNVALRIAGENQSAQEEITRQYEERRKDIRRRELEQQKDAAVFNAIINTAQGVTAALAQANIPLSIIIAALGAAQIAFISSQQIPAYRYGTDGHIGGSMLVNDAPGSNYKEMIAEPGKAPYIPSGRNRIINAPKGTKVFTAHETKEMQSLNKILTSTGIAPISDTLTRDTMSHISMTSINSGITKEEMYGAVKQAISELTIVRQHWDKDGMNEWHETQTTKTYNKNNQVSIKGITL